MLEDVVYPLRFAYLRLPEPLRIAAGTAYGALPGAVVYGAPYARWRAWLPRSERLPEADLEELSWRRLAATLSYAHRRVPWYGRLWAEHGVTPRDVQGPSDLARVPVTTKADVRHNYPEFVSRDARAGHVLTMFTTGSTGAPTRVAYTRGVTRPVDWAFIRHVWDRAGFRDGSTVCALRGARVGGGAGPWLRDPSRHRWSYSGIDLDERGCERVLRHMRSVRPEFLHVFPTVATTLAAYIVSRGIERPLPSLRGVLAGSETTTPGQIDLWRRAFGPGVQVLRWYGLTERACLAGSCERSLDYHVFPQYAYTEFLGADGAPCGTMPGSGPAPAAGSEPASGGRARIVGTGFDNWVMPLIRFDTGDAVEGAGRRCACGRPYAAFPGIAGRAGAWAVTAAGDLVPFTQIAAGIEAHQWAKVLRLQFVQTEPGALALLLVPGAGTSRADLGALAAELAVTVGRGFRVAWEAVDSIDELPGGKHAYFVQRLAVAETRSGALMTHAGD